MRRRGMEKPVVHDSSAKVGACNIKFLQGMPVDMQTRSWHTGFSEVDLIAEDALCPERKSAMQAIYEVWKKGHPEAKARRAYCCLEFVDWLRDTDYQKANWIVLERCA